MNLCLPEGLESDFTKKCHLTYLNSKRLYILFNEPVILCGILQWKKNCCIFLKYKLILEHFNLWPFWACEIGVYINSSI